MSVYVDHPHHPARLPVGRRRQKQGSRRDPRGVGGGGGGTHND